ncbi:MAG TPA: alpha/beta fold hydrolase [Kofleriaceae bacterium]|nr:alpha/beta fold hydrolase [Kofleriaceae bacterium]
MNVAKIFPFRRLVSAPRVRLVCLPYAGGAAALYHGWAKDLPSTIDVCPVELPGRGVRLREPLITDMAAMAEHIAAAIAELPGNLPLALFGHSMGARIAFEVGRLVERRGAGRFDGLVQLFASGSPAPGMRRNLHLDDPRPSAELDDDEFRQRLRQLGGTPRQVLEHDELMAHVLPIVRADFILIEEYRADPDARLSCPLTAFAGAQDPGAAEGDPAMVGWRQRTTGKTRIVGVDAGHFFLESHRADLLREIAHDLAPWLA